VTLGIVLVGAAIGSAIAGWDDFFEAAKLGGAAPSDPALLLVSFLVTMNAVLLAFNLVPAFPLDGGRIARAAVWKLTGDRQRATRLAGFVGQGFAVLLMGFGVFLAFSGNPYDGVWIAVLGYLLGQSARSAVLQTAVTSRLEGVTVADIMDAEPVTVPADLSVQRAYEDFFLRYQGWPWFAVVEPDGRYAGIAHRAAVESAALEHRELPVRDLAADTAEVRDDAPLEALLGSEPLRRLGALMAVDADGRLRGVVTLEQVSRALQARLAPRAS
jgi:CBS domain-containing protein